MGTKKMAYDRPTLKELQLTAKSIGLTLSETSLEEHLAAIAPSVDALNVIDGLPDYVPALNRPLTDFEVPAASDNPYNAWTCKTSIRTGASGKLSGRRVVLKDNIAVAGLPMWNGTALLEGYVPEFDATVATRILEAGGEIVGKARCESLCLSGGSHTSYGGAVRNPHDETRASGGSSSGCGALVGGGHLEMAIGGDQGGSIRIPSAWSGCVGMKPSWGLVPYSGIMPIEATIDHTGPITDTVANNALLLEVIAGPDGLDPRQYGAVRGDYTSGLERGVEGLKIGIVREGFGRSDSEPDVDDAVRAAAQKLARAGAKVTEVSVPWHAQGQLLWAAIGFEGLTQQMMLGNGAGMNWKGLYGTSLFDAFSVWPSRAGELTDTVKNCTLLGKYMIDRYKGRSYAKAQNIARQMRYEIDRVLGQFDALVMPTIPMKATPLPPEDAALPLYLQRAFEMIGNTCPYNVTGHPALNVPCGKSDGLPIGMMLVGRYFDEATLYRIGAAVERSR